MYTNDYKGGKMKKIDIHSHILPGFDDGSSSEAESLRMLKMAAKQGVEDTKKYQAKFGRAKSLMERAIGYQDAGATSVWLIFQGMREFVEG